MDSGTDRAVDLPEMDAIQFVAAERIVRGKNVPGPCYRTSFLTIPAFDKALVLTIRRQPRDFETH
jgi:hypothetical protein